MAGLRLGVVLGVLVAGGAGGQAVTFDVANSGFEHTVAGLPDLAGPLVFGTTTGLFNPGGISMHLATRVPESGPEITQLRVQPSIVSNPLTPEQGMIAYLEYTFAFTTPVPGPMFTIHGIASALIQSSSFDVWNNVQMFIRLRRASASDYLVDWQSGVVGSTSTILDTFTNGPFTGSLQGGQSFELTLGFWASSPSGGIHSAILTSPLPHPDPFVQIDFGVSSDRLCADQNQDGLVTAADFSAWIANFNANSLLADVNQDSVVTAADFSAWIAAYNLGLAGPYCTP